MSGGLVSETGGRSAAGSGQWGRQWWTRPWGGAPAVDGAGPGRPPGGERAGVAVDCRRMRLAIALSFLPVLSCATTDARVARVEHGLVPEDAPSRRLDVAASLARRHVPGVSVAVMDGGRIVWAKGWGVSRAGTDTAVTAETLFNAGSVAKPVAALAAMHLVEAGVVRLDDDVNGRLKSWRVPEAVAREGHVITLRHLLSHTSGIPDTAPPKGYRPGRGSASVAAVLDGDPPWRSLAFAPGLGWSYSGRGYTVVEVLLQDVTGKSFADVVDETVLRPLEMSSSTFQRPLPAALAARAATAHDGEGKPLEDVQRGTGLGVARGGLWTTPTDLLKLALELSGRHRVVRAETAAMMWTEVSHNYGLGLMTTGAGADLMAGHSGHNWGFHCRVVFYPARGQGAAIMTNGENGKYVQNELHRAIAAEYGWANWPAVRDPATMVRQPRTTMEGLAGTYEAIDGPQVGKRARIEVVGDHLELRTEGDTMELFPASADEWFVRGMAALMTFARDASGKGTAISIAFDGEVRRVRRVD